MKPLEIHKEIYY